MPCEATNNGRAYRGAAVLLILLTTNALARDNEIKVLVVMAPGAAVYDEQTITINRLETSLLICIEF